VFDRRLLFNIENLSKSFSKNRLNLFSKDKDVVEAMDNINLKIYKSESLGIVGETGSGKSTLGRCMIRLIEPDTGAVYFDDRELLKLPKKQFRHLRKKFQMIYQSPGQSLNPLQTVKSCISEPLRVDEKLEDEQLESMLKELLHSVGLEEEHLKRFPHQLSGGQKQKVVIARALASNPVFIVADEPTSSLDSEAKKQILDLLIKIKNRLSITVLMISHDISVIGYATDRVAVMLNGRIVELGPTKEILNDPLHPYTKQLIRIARQNGLSNNSKTTEEHPYSEKASACTYGDQCTVANQQCADIMPELIEVAEGRFVACHHQKSSEIPVKEYDISKLNVAI
jgi:oligopeptide/dipeptide ABC transporter ATP-binding protein